MVEEETPKSASDRCLTDWLEVVYDRWPSLAEHERAHCTNRDNLRRWWPLATLPVRQGGGKVDGLPTRRSTYE